MLRSLVLAALGATAALAAPAVERRAGPTVTFRDGTVVGSSFTGIDSWKGIPYAKPPVGDLRLRPPQPLDRNFGTIQTSGIEVSCPQMFFETSNFPQAVLGTLLNNPLIQKVSRQQEDCLTLNVQRPSSATANSKLPVLVWIFGGGFELGATQLYDGSNIIRKSLAMRKDIIFVAMNYRVGGFGFLPGRELKAEGSTNLGLRDQRLALQWVQDNIAAFGGDPSKVTIWGESAGSISVFDHTIINGGDNSYKGGKLFRAAIMNSGSVIPALPVDHRKPQAVFDKVASSAGCGGATDALACLRAADYTKFLNAANSVPGILGYRSIDLSYLPRPDPSDPFFPESPDTAVYKQTAVPVIIGDQEDEGTLFALFQPNITTTSQLAEYLASFFPDADVALTRGLVDAYPDEQAAGSPFGTGPFNVLYPQFKRVAAILGDATFTLTRRTHLDVMAARGIPCWSYLSSYFEGTPIMGTFHASDVVALFFNFNVPNTPSNSILNHYISFVHALDPNAHRTLFTLVNWPKWNDGRKLMNFRKLVNKVIPDDFRQEAYLFLKENAPKLRI